MTFVMTTHGATWRLANSLVQLGAEIAAAHPDFICLGTVGDAAHVSEGTSSDHNPFIKDPISGLGIVRAIDIGGPDAELQALQDHLWSLYAAEFPPLWRYGYALGTSRNLINNWGLPFSTHKDTGDASHLHVSVTQLDGNHPSAAGYVTHIDDVTPWGVTPNVVTPPGGHNPASATYPAMSFLYPFTNADHFGDIKGDRYSHGGNPHYDGVAVIADIKQIQARLTQIGMGPLAVDGVFGPQTIAAATAFQHKYRPNGTTLWGQLWRDDCTTLFGVLAK